MFAVKFNAMFLTKVTDKGYYDYDNESEAYYLYWEPNESSALVYRTQEEAQHMANWASNGSAIVVPVPAVNEPDEIVPDAKFY